MSICRPTAPPRSGRPACLGSMHIELAPPKDEPPQGQLKNGSVIPLSSASTYPTTEQTLGLGVDPAQRRRAGSAAGDQPSVRQGVGRSRKRHAQPADPAGQLHIRSTNDQTDDIIAATEQSQLVGRPGGGQGPGGRQGAHHDPAGAGGTGGSRDQDWPTRSTSWASSAPSPPRRSIRPKNRSSNNLRNIAPVLRELANAGPALTKGLDFLSTYPWVKSTVPNWFRGDFANITLVVDLTLSRMDSGLFTGSRWEGNLTELEMQWGRTIGQMPSPYTAGNPLIAPYHWRGILACCACPARCGPVGDSCVGHRDLRRRDGIRLHEGARVVRGRAIHGDGRPARVRRVVPDVGGDLSRHRDRQRQVGRRHRATVFVPFFR